MSYIAFDLDALNVVPDAARAAGVSQGDLAHGLLKLWAWCFRSEKTEVSSTHLAGFFGGEVGPSLEAFGFLERVTDGWRVRGAERYLRIKDARRRGAEATNAARGKRARSDSGANAQSRSRASGSDAGATLNRTLNDALTPSTEHRAPNTVKETVADATRHPPRETDLLCDDFREIVGSDYVWGGAKDGKAFAQLRKRVSLEEIRARWRAGLQRPADKWLGVRTVAQLALKWNDLASMPLDLSGDWRSRVDHSKGFFDGVGT